MKILVSNDDGIFAPGIKLLAETLKTLGEVIVVAPDRDRSAASHSLTLSRPLRINQQGPGYFSVEGTPTDCVHLAITGALDITPDIVVAGINHGANLGDDVFYSGTVACAIEGRFLGLPAMAISLAINSGNHYATAATVAKNLLLRLIDNPLPGHTILNVNVPDVPYADLRGYEVTRLGSRHCAEPFIQDKDPRGNPIYWIGPPGPEADAGLGTDFYAIKANKVSITPLKLDLTDYSVFEQVSQWTQGIGGDLE